jgi:hypothetical protein
MSNLLRPSLLRLFDIQVHLIIENGRIRFPQNGQLILINIIIAITAIGAAPIVDRQQGRRCGRGRSSFAARPFKLFQSLVAFPALYVGLVFGETGIVEPVGTKEQTNFHYKFLDCSQKRLSSLGAQCDEQKLRYAMGPLQPEERMMFDARLPQGFGILVRAHAEAEQCVVALRHFPSQLDEKVFALERHLHHFRPGERVHAYSVLIDQQTYRRYAQLQLFAGHVLKMNAMFP